MSDCESEFIQLQVTYIKGQSFDGILGIFKDGENLLTLRPDMPPEVAGTILAKAFQVAKVKSQEFNGKLRSNGKEADTALEFTVSIYNDSDHFELDVSFTRPDQ